MNRNHRQYLTLPQLGGRHVERAKTLAYQYKPSVLGRGLYYAQRLVVNPILRKYVVFALGKWVGKSSNTRETPHPLIDPLKRDGIVCVEAMLSPSQCTEIVEYLADKPVYDRYVSIERAFSDARPPDMSFGIHLRENVLDCPHVMELVSSPTMVQLAADYLGCTPTLTCLGIQWSFPTNTPGVAQNFHRDAEDWKYLRVLVYLTDVEEGCGPHVYINGSHLDKLPLRLKRYRPEEILQEYGIGSFVKVFGTRGTGIAADTSGIHKGELPTSKPRLVLSFTYAILPNPMSEYKPLRTRHASLRNYTTRLFLR
jgi:hypothetical protein